MRWISSQNLVEMTWNDSGPYSYFLVLKWYFSSAALARIITLLYSCIMLYILLLFLILLLGHLDWPWIRFYALGWSFGNASPGHKYSQRANRFRWLTLTSRYSSNHTYFVKTNPAENPWDNRKIPFINNNGLDWSSALSWYISA